jgi:hypothetical protein
MFFESDDKVVVVESEALSLNIAGLGSANLVCAHKRFRPINYDLDDIHQLTYKKCYTMFCLWPLERELSSTITEQIEKINQL